MASWGLAAYTGRKMWEDAEKTAEANERYKAERTLFDLQMQEAEENAKLQAQANKESRRIASTLNTHKSKIQRGDKQAFAAFMSSVDTNADTSWSVVGDSVVEQDKSGNIITNIPLGGVSGAAMLSMAQQFVPTAEQVARSYTEGEALNQKYMQELQKQMMGIQANIEIAKLNGASSATVANLNGQYNLLKQELINANNLARDKMKAEADLGVAKIRADSVLGEAKMGAESAYDIAKLKAESELDSANLGLYKEGLKQWQDPNAVRATATRAAVASMFPGMGPQFDSNGNLTMITNTATGEVIDPTLLSPETLSELNNRSRQIATAGLQQATATNFAGPMVGYMTNATNQYINNLNQNIANTVAQADSAIAATQGLPALTVPVPQAQLGVGSPTIDISSLRAPTTVYQYVNPADIAATTQNALTSSFDANTGRMVDAAVRARTDQALRNSGAWWMGNMAAGVPTVNLFN